MTGSTRWLVAQILSIRRTAEPARFNPRPVGVMLPGSTTEAVDAWLLSRPALAWWTRQQLVVATARSGKAVDWALIFLRSSGRVEVCSDHRNPRYLRYRSTDQARAASGRNRHDGSFLG